MVSTPEVNQQITFIYSKDLEAAARFYAEDLGFELALDQGQCRIFRTCSGSFLGVCRERPGRVSEPAGTRINFLTQGLGGWDGRPSWRGLRPRARSAPGARPAGPTSAPGPALSRQRAGIAGIFLALARSAP